jgi:hypothetical protein
MYASLRLEHGATLQDEVLKLRQLEFYARYGDFLRKPVDFLTTLPIQEKSLVAKHSEKFEKRTDFGRRLWLGRNRTLCETHIGQQEVGRGTPDCFDFGASEKVSTTDLEEHRGGS